MGQTDVLAGIIQDGMAQNKIIREQTQSLREAMILAKRIGRSLELSQDINSMMTQAFTGIVTQIERDADARPLSWTELRILAIIRETTQETQAMLGKGTGG